MEMLVTKFSNGKYRNQGELFAETFGVRTCYLELLYERYGTRILCKRKKLSGNCKITRQEHKVGVERIAAQLHVFRDTRYYPYKAQRKSNLRNSYRHRGMFWKQEVLDYIDEKLSQTWSPEQIAKTSCGMKLPLFRTIYRWIDEKYLCTILKNLRRKEESGNDWGTAEELRRERAYGNGIRAHTAAKNSGMESGHGGIGTREKQSMLCHACGEKNEILYCGKDSGQKGRNDGKSDYLRAFRTSERSGKNNYM